MTSYIWNKDCPICGKPRGASEGDPSLFLTPSASYPGLGLIHGDFLSSDDPLHKFCWMQIHWDCYARWPDRERFAEAYYRWQCSVFDRDPDLARAWESDAGTMFVTSDPRPHNYGWIVYRKIGKDSSIHPREWPPLKSLRRAEWLQKQHPFYRECLLEVDRPIADRFPTFEQVLAAADWVTKPTPCRICGARLGASPASMSVCKIPQKPYVATKMPLGEFAGAFAHANCYLGWGERPAFLTGLHDIRRRLERLKKYRGVAREDGELYLLCDRENIPEPKVNLTLLRTGTRFEIPHAAWEFWLEMAPQEVKSVRRPYSHVGDLRPFESEPLLRLLPGLKRDFPTIKALVASIDWAKQESIAAEARIPYDKECQRLMELAARGELTCPRCKDSMTRIYMDEENGLLSCNRTFEHPFDPMYFAWLP